MTAVPKTVINPSRGGSGGEHSHKNTNKNKNDNDNDIDNDIESSDNTMLSKSSFNPYGMAPTVVTNTTTTTSSMTDLNTNRTDHSLYSLSSSSSSSSATSLYNSPIFHEEQPEPNEQRSHQQQQQKQKQQQQQQQQVSSIETPLNMDPYVATDHQHQHQHQHQHRTIQPERLEPYIEPGTRHELELESESQPTAKAKAKQSHSYSQSHSQSQTLSSQRNSARVPGHVSVKGRSKNNNTQKNLHNNYQRKIQKRVPRVTSACPEAFRKMIPPTSFLAEELGTDPVYKHALAAGTVWQSLVGQHVRLPVLWYDGEEPARPYMGCYDALKRNKWSYMGRHRVVNDPKLNQRLVRHPTSSGKLLLHILCRDAETWEVTEDLVIGVFHPNAESIKASDRDFRGTQQSRQQRQQEEHRNEHCRDVWIAHKSRRVAAHGTRTATRIESLLRYLNKNQVDLTPLGGDGGPGQKKRPIDNSNMNAIFGRGSPRNTIFVPEDKLYEMLSPLAMEAKSVPASVVLMRHFLW